MCTCPVAKDASKTPAMKCGPSRKCNQPACCHVSHDRVAQALPRNIHAFLTMYCGVYPADGLKPRTRAYVGSIIHDSLRPGRGRYATGGSASGPGRQHTAAGWAIPWLKAIKPQYVMDIHEHKICRGLALGPGRSCCWRLQSAPASARSHLLSLPPATSTSTARGHPSRTIWQARTPPLCVRQSHPASSYWFAAVIV